MAEKHTDIRNALRLDVNGFGGGVSWDSEGQGLTSLTSHWVTCLRHLPALLVIVPFNSWYGLLLGHLNLLFKCSSCLTVIKTVTKHECEC